MWSPPWKGRDTERGSSKVSQTWWVLNIGRSVKNAQTMNSRLKNARARIWWFDFHQGLPDKNKSVHFFSIFGAHPFWRRFALNIFKKCKCPLFSVLIGSLDDITKASLRSVFGFVIWFTANGQLRSNNMCKNTITLSVSDLSLSILLKSMKKQHEFLAELSMKRGQSEMSLAAKWK